MKHKFLFWIALIMIIGSMIIHISHAFSFILFLLICTHLSYIITNWQNSVKYE